MIRYSQQSISDEDIEAVIDVLRSDWLTQGPAVEKFETAVADYCGAKYAVAVSHGTAALHLACLAMDVGPGDIVWTSPNSFVASANCALYCGASIDFVDIDPISYNISIDSLKTKLRRAEREGRLPKAVVALHFAGQSCEMRELADLGRAYGFGIIEDAAHALGGCYEDTRVGSCTYSDMSAFSFHPVKTITTGEGGMVLTNERDLRDKLMLLRTHGIDRPAKCSSDSQYGEWYYEQVDLGYNYRMTDIQAALGMSQLSRIDNFVGRRARIASRYSEAFSGLPLQVPATHPNVSSAWHLYVVRVRSGKKSERRRVFDELRQLGIFAQVHYIPIHTHPYYRKLGFAVGQFPEAERYYNETLSLPLHPDLSDEEQALVIDGMHKVLP